MIREDTIGIVKAHRWATVWEQARRLEDDGCRIIVSLGGGKPIKQISRDELSTLTRPGTVIKLLWLFLLADLDKRPAHAVKTDLTKWMHRLIEGRGGIIKDVDTGLLTSNPQHRKAIVAVADDMIARHKQGKKSATNSEARRGRPLVTFTDAQLKEAKAIWRNCKDYPTWEDAEEAFPDKFTTARAHRLWGARK
jgi:hypothetical protein